MTKSPTGRPSDVIDRIFSAHDRTDSPGAAVAVTRGGQIICARGYGRAQLEYAVPITASTIFHVASVSKQFTAAAVALLDARGELSLDDDIRTHLPNVPDLGHVITLRHLIHHTSGLRDQWELLRLAGWRMDDVITEEHICRLVHRQRELNFLPGDEHLYSNTGYTLLARTVARVSGMSFRSFLEANLFAPLGMHRTHVHDDHEEIVPGRAYSYRLGEDQKMRRSVLNYANAGATSLFTTVEDLARWLVNLDTGRVGGSGLMQKLHRRFTLNDGETIPYAFGLTHARHRGLRVVGHSGADAGFRSFCGRFPALGLGVVVLSNLAQFNPHRAAMRVAEAYIGDQMPEPRRRTFSGGPLIRRRLRACTGHYLLGTLGCIEVRQRDGGLTLHRPGEPPAVLHPAGDLTFRAEPQGANVTFELDGDRARGFSLQTGGRTLRAERYELHPVDPDRLRQLAGRYYSEELDTAYTVTAADGRLRLAHIRLEDAELLPLSDDTFQSRGARPGRLEFSECGGRVTGFTVTGSRVRGLRFVRMSGTSPPTRRRGEGSLRRPGDSPPAGR